MRRRFTIIGIVIFLVLVAFVMTGCSQLSSQQSTVDDKFSDLVPELVIRYKAVDVATSIAVEVGGKRDVTDDSKKALVAFNKARADKNTDAQLSSAREIETIIGRLNSNAASSPRLSGSAELKAALVEVDKALPALNVRTAYSDAVQDYEDTRTSWRNSISAFFGGYDAPQKLEFWINPSEFTNQG